MLAIGIGAYEILPATISALPSFYGLAKENPYNHILEFLKNFATPRLANITPEQVKLRLFSFLVRTRQRYSAHALRGINYHMGPDVQDIFIKVLSGKKNERNV